MKTLNWIVTIVSLAAAIFFYFKDRQCERMMQEIVADRGTTIEALKNEIKEEKAKITELTKDKIKAEKEYVGKLAEYKRIIDSQGTQKVYIERKDTIYAPILWTAVDTVERLKMPDAYKGDIFKYNDKWNDFRVYYDGFLVNMDYEVRDSIVFDLTEYSDGWYIKGRSLNPATKVTGLDKLVKRTYPETSMWGYTTVGMLNLDPYVGVGFQPTWEWKNFMASGYGEVAVLRDGAMNTQVGVRVGIRLK